MFEALPTEICVKHLKTLPWSRGIIRPLYGPSCKIYSPTRGHVYNIADCHKEYSVPQGYNI